MDEARCSRSDKSRPWRGAGLPGESWSGERPPRPSWGARAPRRCLLSTMPKVPPLPSSPRRPKRRVPWAKHTKPLRLHSHWTIKMTEAPHSPTRWKPHGAPRGLHLQAPVWKEGKEEEKRKRGAERLHTWADGSAAVWSPRTAPAEREARGPPERPPGRQAGAGGVEADFAPVNSFLPDFADST